MLYLYKIEDSEGERMDWGVLEAPRLVAAKEQLRQHFSEWMDEPLTIVDDADSPFAVWLVPVRTFSKHNIAETAESNDVEFYLQILDDL